MLSIKGRTLSAWKGNKARRTNWQICQAYFRGNM